MLLVPCGRLGAELPEDWSIESFTWSGAVGAAGSLSIANRFGDLRVRPSADERVHLSAVIQRHVDDPARAEIHHVEGDAGFEIAVTYPSVFEEDAADQPETWHRRRVDLTLFVPVALSLTAETDRGLIEVKAPMRAIAARSSQGDIVLATSGPVDAHSERGAIEVQFSGTDWKQASRLETLTGDVVAWLPPAAALVVHLETFGLLTTDWSLEVTRPPGSQRKMARAVIGADGAELYLRSNRGNLSILRSAF